MQLLRGQEGEALLQVVANLTAEDRSGAGSGAVAFLGAVLQDVGQELKILLHGKFLSNADTESIRPGASGCRLHLVGIYYEESRSSLRISLNEHLQLKLHIGLPCLGVRMPQVLHEQQHNAM